MSRSNKKSPVCKQKNDRFYKGYANRVIRQTNGRLIHHYQFIGDDERDCIPSGRKFRRYSCRWNICDWRSRLTLKEYLLWERDRMGERYNDITRERHRDDWEKMYRRK